MVHHLLYVNRLYTSTEKYLKASRIKLQKCLRKCNNSDIFQGQSVCVIYKSTMRPWNQTSLILLHPPLCTLINPYTQMGFSCVTYYESLGLSQIKTETP